MDRRKYLSHKAVIRLVTVIDLNRSLYQAWPIWMAWHEQGTNHLCSTAQRFCHARVPQVRGSIQRRTSHKKVLLLEPISVHDLCTSSDRKENAQSGHEPPHNCADCERVSFSANVHISRPFRSNHCKVPRMWIAAT